MLSGRSPSGVAAVVPGLGDLKAGLPVIRDKGIGELVAVGLHAVRGGKAAHAVGDGVDVLLAGGQVVLVQALERIVPALGGSDDVLVNLLAVAVEDYGDGLRQILPLGNARPRLGAVMSKVLCPMVLVKLYAVFSSLTVLSVV